MRRARRTPITYLGATTTQVKTTSWKNAAWWQYMECYMCTDEVKHESMFYYASIAIFRTYFFCTRCCPTVDDVISNNTNDFGKRDTELHPNVDPGWKWYFPWKGERNVE